MMAAKRKRKTGKPPEENRTRGEENIVKEKQRTSQPVEVVENGGNEQKSSREKVSDFPFKETVELPNLENTVKSNAGFQNKAPLQADERARDLLIELLQNPIGLTAEDVLNISDPMRMELKRMLTKPRIEKKPVTFASEPKKIDEPWRDVSSLTTRNFIDELPLATCEILEEDREGMSKGGIVIGDPVSQYLATLKPGDKPKIAVVARESQGLRAIYPLINGVGEVESLLDSGSQIISMARTVAQKLDVSWDPDITIEMESAN